MEEKKLTDVEAAQKSLDIILQEGVDFPITVNNLGLLHRLKLKKKVKKFIIYPICLGSLDRIAGVILSMSLEELGTIEEKKENLNPMELLDIGLKNIKANRQHIVKVLAMAITNQNPKHWNPLIMFYRKWRETKIASFLSDNLVPKEMYRLLVLVIRQMEINDLLGSMVSIKRANLMETSDYQTNGPSSETLSNTSDSAETKSSGAIVGQTS